MSRLKPASPVAKMSLSAGCSAALAAALCLAASAEPQGTTLKKNGAVEFLKYFNPVQKKSYLNESQDRVIKKKAFKTTAQADMVPVPNREIGIFAVIKPGDLADDKLTEGLLARPDVNGLSVTLPWKQLEPAEDEFNWTGVDHLLDIVKQHDKTLILRVSTGGLDLPGEESDTPGWVFDAGVQSLTYTGADGKSRRIPIFWDSNYLANWRNFVKAMARRYDSNPAIHSIGITGGGIAGGTAVVPDLPGGGNKDAARELEQKLKKEFGMNQRQLVEHWKYVADIFPKYFTSARLNFDIDPPVAHRAGQDALDEISDYLIYRYGQRIYLTRQNVADDRHGFDQYRVLLKFRHDTLTGYQLSPGIKPGSLQKLAQNALDDGVSFAEVPTALLASQEAAVKGPLAYLASHVGYEILSRKATVAPEIRSGQPLKASFSFLNLGAAAPMRPNRTFDKDVASSYRVLIELRAADGKPVVLSLHTPPTPTNEWVSGKPVSYEEELKMPQLPPGDYTVFLWMVDADKKRKLQLLDAISQDRPTPAYSIPLGKVHVLPEPGAQTAKQSTDKPADEPLKIDAGATTIGSEQQTELTK